MTKAHFPQNLRSRKHATLAEQGTSDLIPGGEGRSKWREMLCNLFQRIALGEFVHVGHRQPAMTYADSPYFYAQLLNCYFWHPEVFLATHLRQQARQITLTGHDKLSEALTTTCPFRDPKTMQQEKGQTACRGQSPLAWQDITAHTSSERQLLLFDSFHSPVAIFHCYQPRSTCRQWPTNCHA